MSGRQFLVVPRTEEAQAVRMLSGRQFSVVPRTDEAQAVRMLSMVWSRVVK